VGVTQFSRSLSDFNQAQLDLIIGSSTRMSSASNEVQKTLANIIPLDNTYPSVWKVVVNMQGSIRYKCDVDAAGVGVNIVLRWWKNGVMGPQVIWLATSDSYAEYVTDIPVVAGDNIDFTMSSGGGILANQRICYSLMTEQIAQTYP
jgi:hypothetical protein